MQISHPPTLSKVTLGEAGDKNLLGDSRKSVARSLLMHNCMATGTLNGPQLVVNCYVILWGPDSVRGMMMDSADRVGNTTREPGPKELVISNMRIYVSVPGGPKLVGQ